MSCLRTVEEVESAELLGEQHTLRQRVARLVSGAYNGLFRGPVRPQHLERLVVDAVCTCDAMWSLTARLDDMERRLAALERRIGNESSG